MQETIAIRLPEKTRTALDDVTRQEGIEPVQVVNKAIEEYLFFRRLRLMQERMIA
jgi:predicted DNA-binding protein